MEKYSPKKKDPRKKSPINKRNTFESFRSQDNIEKPKELKHGARIVTQRKVPDNLSRRNSNDQKKDRALSKKRPQSGRETTLRD